jgi:hypothetical protein
LSTKVEQRLQWRRDKVRELSVKGYSQRHIATTLKVGLASVNEDLQYLRARARDNIRHYIDEYLPAEYENCLEGLNEIMTEAWNISTDAGSDSGSSSSGEGGGNDDDSGTSSSSNNNSNNEQQQQNSEEGPIGIVPGLNPNPPPGAGSDSDNGGTDSGSSDNPADQVLGKAHCLAIIPQCGYLNST